MRPYSCPPFTVYLLTWGLGHLRCLVSFVLGGQKQCRAGPPGVGTSLSDRMVNQPTPQTCSSCSQGSRFLWLKIHSTRSGVFQMKFYQMRICYSPPFWCYYRRATWLALWHPEDSDDFVLMWAIVVYCRLYKFPSKVYRQNTDISTTGLRSIDQSYDLKNAHPLLVKILKVTWCRNHDKLSIGCYPSQAGVHTLSLRWHWLGREQLLLNSCHNSDSR